MARQKTELKRQQILEGAARAFQANGYHGTTLNDVAREVGCSKVTIYSYFNSRDDLLQAVIVESSRSTMEYLGRFGTKEATLTAMLDRSMCKGRQLFEEMASTGSTHSG